MKDLLDSNFLNSIQVVDWAYTEKLKAISFDHFIKWSKSSLSGNLTYLQDDRADKRTDLSSILEKAQSSLVFLFDYTHSAKMNIENNDFKIASYTKGFEGVDYHYWIKEKLELICKKLKLSCDEYTFSIDVKPVLERDLAYRAGLGWFGKNSMLISKDYGSFFIIGSIILSKTLDLNIREVETDHCGTCTRCIDACPTNAIVDNKVIDASRCISTFTIEVFKNEQRPDFFDENRPEVFGCDVCQNVCPWNSRPLKKNDKQSFDFDFFKRDLSQIKSDLQNMSNREFRRVFKGTPLERTGRVGILKNITN
ncbi:MAG: tRNA epoxyqueuosine(34) reductase QueG [Bacteriovoracaceae bacterium]|jgi:epoxyqueuosine reductase|nr:tRNA epoxyqueuosine(34) reductase QueG [Bacteriovoracaceae bacterium]